MFEITAKEALGRIGKFTINKKTIVTPNILPVVHPKIQVIPPAEMRSRFGVNAIFTNAYIISRDENLAAKVLDKGVHAHLGFTGGIIATDSGAFQHYMYGTDDLKAESIEPFQERIGSDLGVILDQPVQIDDDRAAAATKVRTTLARAAANVARRASGATGWYGPIHGGRYPDLIEQSATTINTLDFVVHAIGGVVKLLNQYQFSIVSSIILHAKQFLDPSRPVHLFGAGHPMVFALYVALGCDLFDSAAYSLFAKEGRYITETGTWMLGELDEFPCACPVCTGHSPGELLKFDVDTRFRLLAEHNLFVTMRELRVVREHMREGSLWQLVETRCRNHPRLLEALRVVLDSGAAGRIGEEEPVFKDRAAFYTGPETLSRPDVKSLRESLPSKHSISNAVQHVVIIPDLDVNAISSPQHARWMKAIATACESAGIDRTAVLVLVLNPVFGLIPEDLLPVYPFSHNLFPMVLDADQLATVREVLAAFFRRVDLAGKMVTVLLPPSYVMEIGLETPLPWARVVDMIGELKGQLAPGHDINIISTVEELETRVKRGCE